MACNHCNEQAVAAHHKHITQEMDVKKQHTRQTERKIVKVHLNLWID